MVRHAQDLNHIKNACHILKTRHRKRWARVGKGLVCSAEGLFSQAAEEWERIPVETVHIL